MNLKAKLIIKKNDKIINWQNCSLMRISKLETCHKKKTKEEEFMFLFVSKENTICSYTFRQKKCNKIQWKKSKFWIDFFFRFLIKNIHLLNYFIIIFCFSFSYIALLLASKNYIYHRQFNILLFTQVTTQSLRVRVSEF